MPRHLVSVLLSTTFIGLLTTTPRGFAEEIVKVRSVEYVVPTGSQVKFKGPGQYSDAHFEGTFELRGTFHYGHLTTDPTRDAKHGILELYFLPDKETSRMLPYWKNADEGVHEVRFKNPEDVVKALVTEETVQRLQAFEILSVSGPAVLIVKDYVADVECDYPWYRVQFVSVKREKKLVTTRRPLEQFGC
jgi:hypothetical protein